MSCQEKSVFVDHLKILFKFVVSAYIEKCDYSAYLRVSSVEEFDIANLLWIDFRYCDDYALRYVSKEGHLPVVQYLVEERCADIHADYDSALRHSSQHLYL